MWAGAEPEGRMAEIRKWYDAVQEGKATAERGIKFEAKDEPLSGEVTVREYGEGLKAVTLSYSAGDHGGADEHYYYREGELFFVFLEQSMWVFAGQETPEGVSITRDTLTEQRLYLEKGACFRLLRREASGTDVEKVSALLKKAAQKEVKPDDETAEVIGRGQSLLTVKTAGEVLKVFAAELEPVE